MLTGLLVAGLAPALGLSILLVPRGRAVLLGAARTFALASALAIVVMELVPSAVESLGVGALLVTALALWLPGALGRGLASVAGHLPGLVLGAIGLGVHQLFDGAQMGAATVTLGLGVVIALAAHVSPLVAVTVLSAERHGGRRLGVAVGVAMVVATLIGFAGGSALQGAFASVESWLRAAIAGFLLHVVGHDIAEDLPEGVVGRSADLVAAVVGFAVVVLFADGGHVVEAHAHHGHGGFAMSLFTLTNESALVLLAGLVVSAALHAVGKGALDPRPVEGSARGAASGASLAVEVPAFLGELMPVGRAMVRTGFGPAVFASFMVALPASGLDTFAVSVQMLGWPMALVRFALAMTVAMAGGAVFGWLARSSSTPERLPVPNERDSYGARWAAAFDELLHHIAPQMAVGLVIASYMLAFVHTHEVSWLQARFTMPLMSLIAVPLTVVGSATVPVAESLWSQGMSAGTVLTGLVLGPGLGLAMLTLLREVGGTRATLGLVVVVVGLTWGAGLGIDQLGWESLHDHHDDGDVAVSVPTVLLAIAVIRAMWLHGPRAWLAGLWGIDSHDHHHHHR